MKQFRPLDHATRHPLNNLDTSKLLLFLKINVDFFLKKINNSYIYFLIMNGML